MKLARPLALTVALSLLLTACSGAKSNKPAENQTPTEIKGTVNVYTPHQGTLLDDWGTGFAAVQPNAKAQTTRIGTTQLLGRLRAEKANPQADIWIGGGGIVPFITATNEGLLASYKPKGAEKLDELTKDITWHDPDWNWTAANLIAMGIVYNPHRIKKEDLPKTWDDLADPKWQGKIEMWDPTTSGTSAAFVLMNLQRLGEEKGWEYLKKVYKNVSRYTAQGSPAASVARGEVDLGITFEHTALIFRDDAKRTGGNPDNVSFVLPEKTLVMAEPISLVKNSPNQAAGKAFADYILSPEGQKVLAQKGFMYPVLPGVDTPPGAFYKVEDYYQRAMKLDPNWMAKNLDATLKAWKNNVETSK